MSPSPRLASAPATPAAKARPAKFTRAERNAATKHNLFRAAAKIVGRYGYAEASVARITSEAGIAQGTFYNHFENRQELLDQLLPEIGKDMLDFIRARTDPAAPEHDKEAGRFRAFFGFLEEVPEFLRILNEAEFFAPEGYRQHMANVSDAYARILKRGRDKGEVRDFTDAEIEVLAHMFMGARGYLGQRYARSDATAQVPPHVLTAYDKLLTGGLFSTDAPVKGKPGGRKAR